jgi:hypothetical protein
METTLIDIRLTLFRLIFDQNQKKLQILNHHSIHDRIGKKPSHATVPLRAWRGEGMEGTPPLSCTSLLDCMTISCLACFLAPTAPALSVTQQDSLSVFLLYVQYKS